MKKATLLSLLIFSQILHAQITISNAYFPTVGDSLKMAIANTATARQLRISPAGGNQTWLYNFLRANINTRPTYTEGYATPDSATLAAFPTADLVRNLTTTGQKEVFNKTTTRFERLGYVGFSLGFLNLPIRPSFNQAVLERRAPLAFNSTHSHSASFSVAFASNLLPDTLLAGLPIRPDSLRLRFQTSRQDRVDAWGEIWIPGGKYEALRERRFEQTELKLEAKIGSFVWLDITSILLQGGRPPKDTTLSYYFWSNAVKEPIAIVEFRNETDTIPSRVDYKFLPINTQTAENSPLYPDGVLRAVSATLFPNPTTGNAQLLVNHSEPMVYRLLLSNNLGQVVYDQKHFLKTGTTLPLPLAHLPSGVYFLNLVRLEIEKPDRIGQVHLLKIVRL
jgi:hypothetical protein